MRPSEGNSRSRLGTKWMRLIAANALQESIRPPMNPAGPNVIVDTKTKAERTTVVTIIAIQSLGQLIAYSPWSARRHRLRSGDHLSLAECGLTWQVAQAAEWSFPKARPVR